MNRRKFLWTGAIFVPASKSIAQAGLRSPAFVGGLNKPAASSACATTDTSISHDEFLEGFQDPTNGYNDGNSWTFSTTGTGAAMDFKADSAALTSGKPTGACDRAFKIILPTDGTETYATWNKGSTIDMSSQSLDCTFYLYVEAEPEGTENFYIWSLTNGAGPVSNAIAVVKYEYASGSPIIYASGASNSGTKSLTAGAWHKIEVHCDSSTTGGLSTLKVDGSAAASGFNRGNFNPQYLFAGGIYGLESGDSGTFWFDLLCVNSP